MDEGREGTDPKERTYIIWSARREEGARYHFFSLLDATREHDMGGQCCHVAPPRSVHYRLRPRTENITAVV